MHSCREHDRGGIAAHHIGAAEGDVRGLDQRSRRRPGVESDQNRYGLTGESRQIDLERSRQESRIGGHAVAFGQEDHVARHERPDVDRLRRSLTGDARPGWQKRRQCFDRLLGVSFLHERERGVEQDHDDNRDTQRR